MAASNAATLPPAAEAPASAAQPVSSSSGGGELRQFSLAELVQLSRADLEREWGAHGVRAIPSGCSQDAVEITYDASGAPHNTTKPTWTGKCLDKNTRIPANILSGVRTDATDKPASIKPSSFDGKDALVFEYPGDWSLHLRELGPDLYVGRQARAGAATGVVYIVGRFKE